MKKRRRWLLVLGSVLLTLGSIIALGAYHLQRRARESAIATTLEWGRLAPFPESVQHFQITTEGSMFSRAFRVEFGATPDMIDRWIAGSPGMRDLEPDKSQPNIRRYHIVPGGGAQHAEVEIDDVAHTVKVYVYWS